VVPGPVARSVTFPILTAVATVVGLIGSDLGGVVMMGVDRGAFFQQLYWVVDPTDVYSGLIKSVVMGFMMTVICSFFGFYSARGAKGVGEAATRAVVTSSVGILVADYIMADLMIKLMY
jgi:phospholipid/cholesterol/gamma-HCH transport system permease protein